MSRARELLNLLESGKINWKKDNVGGYKAEVTSRNGATYTVHASMDGRGGFGWIVARANKVMDSGKSKSIEDAKSTVVKWIKGAEARGM